MTDQAEEIKVEEPIVQVKPEEAIENHKIYDEKEQQPEAKKELVDEDPSKSVGDPEQYIKHRLQNRYLTHS